MTTAKQIQRITALAAFDRGMAQREYDIAARSAGSAKTLKALQACAIALGLNPAIQYL